MLILKHKYVFICTLGFVFLRLIASVAFAEAEVPNNAAQASIQITWPDHKHSTIRLEVKQAPLADILEKIAQTTHIPIHYALLPEEPVTATCTAETVSNLLECLLGSRVDRVYRYPQPFNLNTANPVNTTAIQPEEVWLLATLTPVQPGIRENIPAPAKDTLLPEPTSEDRAQLEATLKQAASKNIDERSTALYNLGLIGQKDDADIRKTLQAALTDKNANVRIQAITSLMQREGEDAAIEVQQALKDKDINVRMAVLSKVYDTATLQQALSDSDKTIRDMATAKLNALAYRQNR